MTIFNSNTELYFLLFLVAFEPDIYFARRSFLQRMLSRDLKQNLDFRLVADLSHVQFSFSFVSSTKLL